MEKDEFADRECDGMGIGRWFGKGFFASLQNDRIGSQNDGMEVR